MRYTFEFKTEEEKEIILNQQKDKFLIEINYLITGNSLVFTDEKPIELEIDTLKQQNADLENALVELASMVGGA